MAANATEDELRAVRESLADVPDPFEGIQAVTGKSGAGEGPREEGNHLDTREAAARLGLSPKTLERCRASGEGPEFQRFGSRVRYLPADLESWASARRWTSLSQERSACRKKQCWKTAPGKRPCGAWKRQSHAS
ncbi:MAG: helix-turn-helix domain-containing protein [Chloroflexi bacterium]|nr:helix-turn-helix domain-containing protein [Chloroflexota bacterium]